MYRIMRRFPVFILLLCFLYGCSHSFGSEEEPLGPTIELNVSDILLRTETEALPERTIGSKTTLLLIHETWLSIKDSLSLENHPTSLTLIQGKRSIRMIVADEISPSLAGKVIFVLEDNDMASVVVGSMEFSEDLSELLSGIETVPARSDLVPPAPDNSPLGIYPVITEVDLRTGADFVVVSAEESYIYQACFHAPALGPVKEYIVEDCFDKSFVQYEDERFSMEQISGREYHFVVKPIPNYNGESFSLTFYFIPAYLDHYQMKDGTTIILCH